MKYIQEIVKENGMKKAHKKVVHFSFDGCCAGATYSAASSHIRLVLEDKIDDRKFGTNFCLSSCKELPYHFVDELEVLSK